MSWAELALYGRLGLSHITDLGGYDHIVFVVALTVAYGVAQWRQLLVLVTAFTLGHSVTLALATWQVVRVSSALVETAIPVTIVATALATIGSLAGRVEPVTGSARPAMVWRYAMAGGFGLIHGLGFSGYLRSLLGPEVPVAMPLLAFNVGLELGQLAIVAVVLGAGTAITRWTRMPEREWVLVMSGAAAGIATVMTFERAFAA